MGKELQRYSLAFQGFSRKQLYYITNVVYAVSDKQAIFYTCEAFKEAHKTSSFRIASNIKCEVIEDNTPTEKDDNIYLIWVEIEPDENTRLLCAYKIIAYVIFNGQKYEARDKVSAYSEKQAKFDAYNRIKHQLNAPDISFYKPTKAECTRIGISRPIWDLANKYLDIRAIG